MLPNESNWWSQLDSTERRVVELWRDSHRSQGVIINYLGLARAFRSWCKARGFSEVDLLTEDGLARFAPHYRSQRQRWSDSRRVRQVGRSALRAWAHAISRLGKQVPQWQPPLVAPDLPSVISEYSTYCCRVRGLSPTTIRRHTKTALVLRGKLKEQGRSLSSLTLHDLDSFFVDLARRQSRAAVVEWCSSLRSFLRFLRTSGRVKRDLASLVVSPRVPKFERPRRALPWPDVVRLLRAVRRDQPLGRRDYAIMMLMATSGMGSAEVASLQLADIDWLTPSLTLRRPKTGAPLTLPLLPAVANAIVAYLRDGRPRHGTARSVFLSHPVPHRPITSRTIRALLRNHAREAGLEAPVSGHTLRHSFATRQVDSAVDIKLVGDILGHRRPESTSAYVRVAMRRLRAVALPVPQ